MPNSTTFISTRDRFHRLLLAPVPPFLSLDFLYTLYIFILFVLPFPIVYFVLARDSVLFYALRTFRLSHFRLSFLLHVFSIVVVQPQDTKQSQIVRAFSDSMILCADILL